MTTAGGSDPQPLSRAISELIAVRGLAHVRGDRQIASVWEQVAGPAIARRTKVLGVSRGVLSVGVASSALLNELVSFHKTSLLAALQNEHANLRIRDLRFRLKSDVGGA